MMGRRGVALLALVWLMAPYAVGSDASPATIDWQTLGWDGVDRTCGVYVPDILESPAPLVVLLHGGGGSASKTWAQEHGRSWKALADEHGFALLLPEGRSDPGDPDAHHWNDCRVEITSEDAASDEEDVGFILHAIDSVVAEGSIDADRVFVTGASNGGMMTFRLALETGGHFSAAAAIIANQPNPSECRPSTEPIPILIMNGTDDSLVPYEGGCVAGESCERGRVMSTPETVSFWVEVNRASETPTVERLPNRSWLDGSTVTVYAFDAGVEGADVVYYHVKGGGHAVPGFERPSALRLAIGGPKNRDIDGPTEIWSFFESQD